MFAYQSVHVPGFARQMSPRRLAQTSTPAVPKNLTPTMVKVALTSGLAIETALGAAGAWVGIWTGLNAKGLLKFVGYGIGILSGVSGLVSLAELGLYVWKGMPVPTELMTPPVQKTTSEFVAQ